MGRIIIWNLFLFSLPFLLSWVWMRWVQRSQPTQKTRKFYAIATAIGTVLVLVSLLVWRAGLGSAPGGTYVSPEVQDGKVVPGHFE